MLTSLPMLQLHQRGGARYFTFPELEQIPSFVHGVTHRDVTGLQPLPDRGGPWTASQRRFMDALELSPDDLFFLRQIHSDRIVVASGPRPTGLTPPEADGVVWSRSGFFPVIRTADCVPVIVVAPDCGVAGVFHAGWRGTCSRIVEQGVKRVRDRTGNRGSRLVAAIGPAMRQCCYEVGEEVRQAFRDAGHDVEGLFEEDHLDLAAANRSQLEATGVSVIADSQLCTGCENALFYSWRQEKTEQRTWTVAGFR